jgi:3-methylcrotonyl-CoA carboxylase alpha subunit
MVGRSWIWPVTSNGAFLFECLDHADFRSANLSTAFISDNEKSLKPIECPSDEGIEDALSELASVGQFDFAADHFSSANWPMGFRLNREPQKTATIFWNGQARLATFSKYWSELSHGSNSASVIRVTRPLYPEQSILVERGRTFLFHSARKALANTMPTTVTSSRRCRAR